MSNRRQFMIQVSLGSGVLVAGNAMAQAPLVNEADGQVSAGVEKRCFLGLSERFESLSVRDFY